MQSPSYTGASRCHVGRNDMDVVPSSDYFDAQQRLRIACRKAIFNVYKAGAEERAELVLLLIHGAGTSGLSWALFCKEFMKTVADFKCGCLAPDLRGHGETVTENDQDLSMRTLVVDMLAVLDACVPSSTPVCLVGHSLGGAIATNLASELNPSRLKLLVMIDLTEGSAMSAKKMMGKILQNRPDVFRNMRAAIRFLLKSGQVRNAESAKVSAPGYFCPCDAEEANDEQLAFSHCQGDFDEAEESTESSEEATPPAEEKDSCSGPPCEGLSAGAATPGPPVRWRVQLSQTSQYWDDWFMGLSSRFLALSVPKLLILSNLQKLDTELTIGQMRGQFQLNVFPQGGHALNEDMPQELAETIAVSLKRYRLMR